MLTKFFRRFADRFTSWTDNLPDGPFEGSLLYAALALSERSLPYMSAEIGVDLDHLTSYVEGAGPSALDAGQRRRLKRFFSRRGIFEVRLPFAVGVVLAAGILRREARRASAALAWARRVIALENKGSS